LRAACVAANGVPLRDPLKPMPPALDQATTLPSVSVMVTTVLLKEACTCARPWCTTRFSPRFLKVFFRLPAPSFFSGVAPSGAVASVFAIVKFTITTVNAELAEPADRQASACSAVSASDVVSYGLLLRNRTLARPLAGARVGAGPLSTYRKRTAVPHA